MGVGALGVADSRGGLAGFGGDHVEVFLLAHIDRLRLPAGDFAVEPPNLVGVLHDEVLPADLTDLGLFLLTHDRISPRRRVASARPVISTAKHAHPTKVRGQADTARDRRSRRNRSDAHGENDPRSRLFVE